MTISGDRMTKTSVFDAPPVRDGRPGPGGATLVVPALALFYRAAEPISYLLLRAVLGVILFTHGLPKLLGGSHGRMADPYGKSAGLIGNNLHLPFARLFTDFVVGIETAGAICLGLGLFTRIVAPMVAVEMAMICVVFWPTWVWLDRGMEYAFLMGVVALHLSMRGGGRYSLDRLIGREL